MGLYEQYAKAKSASVAVSGTDETVQLQSNAALVGTQDSDPVVRAELINGLGGDAGFGEQVLTANDDRSTGEIDVSEIFEDGLNFFGREFTSLWINNNGGVTFNGPRGAFTPTVITENNNNPEITPFFADVDTRGGAIEPSPGGTSTGSNLVYYDFDTVSDSFIVTWDDVGYYSGQTGLINSFQLILSDVGGGDFDIEFRYENIEWTTGNASGGSGGLGGTPARAGFTASTGNPNAYFELPASGDEAAILLLDETVGNTGQTGIWEFSVRSGEINSGDIPELPDFTLTGATSGDPHLVTLDGVAYDFHAAGEYVLLRATNGADFEVQSRMTPVEGSENLTVNSAIALRAGGSDVLIDSTDDNPFSVDGVEIAIDNFGFVDVGTDRVFRSNNVYTVILSGDDNIVNDGDSQIEITVYDGRVDLVLSLNDDLAGNLEGLLGDADGDPTNDVALANGTPLLRPFAFEDVYGQYRDDWRVDAIADSLFTYDEGETLEGFYLEDHPAAIADLSAYTDEEIAIAAAALVAAGLVEGTVNYNNALLDYLATDDTTFIDAAGDLPELTIDPDTIVQTAAELGRPTNDDDVVVGTAEADVIDGLDGNDVISGLGGNDDISGSAGGDTITGGTGNDVLRGGTGNDKLKGGTGDDKIKGGSGDDILKGNGGDDILKGGTGDDLINGGGGNDLLKGQGGNDILKGGTGDDLLKGGAGDDTLKGGSGADKLKGGTGADLLKGGGGADILNGGGGNDIINGGNGADKLTGGTGADKFVFAENHGTDRIVDFDINHDTLSLDADLVGGMMSGSAVLADYADVTSNGVELDFGGGNVITLENLTSLSGLADNINIF